METLSTKIARMTRTAMREYINEASDPAERAERERETREYGASVSRLLRLGVECVENAMEQQKIGMN